MNNYEESARLRLEILRQLAQTPDGYMQAETPLYNSVALAMCPDPSRTDFAAALVRLEADKAVKCVPNEYRGKMYAITDYGRARLADALN